MYLTKLTFTQVKYGQRRDVKMIMNNEIESLVNNHVRCHYGIQVLGDLWLVTPA
jgi:hypothetical protein